MKNMQKTGALFLALLLILSLTGRGKGGPSDGVVRSEQAVGNAKGRYMEEEMKLPEEVSRAYRLFSHEDGSCWLVSAGQGIYRSADQGKTWELQQDSWKDRLEGQLWDCQMNPDGSWIVSIMQMPENQEDMFNEDVELTFDYWFISPDGEEKKLEPDQHLELYGIRFLTGETLVGWDIKGNVYEISLSDGKTSKLFETGSYIYNMGVGDRYLIPVCQKYQNQIYDVEKKEMADPDPVLGNFLSKVIETEAGRFMDGAQPLELRQVDGKEDAWYLICKDGLFYHVLQGAVMQQMINGELATMGDPSVRITGMLSSQTGEENPEFLVLYDNLSLIRYYYDPEIAAVPEKELKVYSLEENTTLRQAASLYQKSHPDVYVKCETGLSGQDGMTVEDAVKNLNTEIMAGNGPDLLLLDGLPMKSYIEKGVLEDLTPYLEDGLKGGRWFENIVNAYAKDGKIYAVPSRFAIPIIAGREEDIGRITDLDTLADTIERMREEYPSGKLLGADSEIQLLNMLAAVSSPAWVNGDGTLNETSLTQFLTDAKRIWDVEKTGISQAAALTGMGGEEGYRQAAQQAGGWFAGSQRLAAGQIYSIMLDFSTVTSVIDQNPGSSFKLWEGQSKSVFLPSGIVGIQAKSEEKELAVDFFQSIFEEEAQKIYSDEGYPVEKNAFEDMLVNENDVSFGTMAVDTPDGLKTLECKWPLPEQLDWLRETAGSLTTPGITDDTIQNTVLDLAPAALNGEKTVQETVSEILKKVQIYLAE